MESFYKIVVAVYNEDIKWLSTVNKRNVIVYNKSTTRYIENSIPLKNEGREGETYLRYIIDNYNNLPKFVIFVQGHPFDHMKNVNETNFQKKLRNLFLKGPPPKTIEPLFTEWNTEHLHRYPLHFSEYHNLLFGNALPNDIQFAAGCQYIDPKESILSNGIDFYINLRTMLLKSTLTDSKIAHYTNHPFDPNSINPWTFERIFPYLFLQK